MRYDVEGDWQLLLTCNYRCDYCFLNDQALGEKIRVHATPQQWRAAFDDTGKTWLLHLTGGEPTHYPDFVALCEALSARHYLSLNSNMTGGGLLDFAQRIDPARVSFINAGLHPAERARKQGETVFLRHVEALLRRDFPVMVSVVATPEVLRGFDAIIDQLKPVGLVPIPKLMQGGKRRNEYPAAYTPEERKLFRRYSLMAERANPRIFDGPGERPTIDPTLGRDHLHRRPDYRGQPCSAGQELVKIEPDGNVGRCGNGPTMGNLLARNIRFADGPAPCDRSHCFYFCEKYTQRAAPKREAPLAALIGRMRGLFEKPGLGA